MKKVRVYLSAVAVIMAISGAFASRAIVDVNGYTFVNDGTPVSVDCTFHNTCSDSGSTRCTSNSTGANLFKVVSSICDQPVNRN